MKRAKLTAMSSTQQRLATSKRIKLRKLKEIKTFSDPIQTKNQDNVRFFFDNVNGLPTNTNQQSSFKYRRLRHLLNKLDIDVFSLVETQINLDLSSPSVNIKHLLSRN